MPYDACLVIGGLLMNLVHLILATSILVFDSTICKLFVVWLLLNKREASLMSPVALISAGTSPAS